MSILGKGEIITALSEPDIHKRLIVTPLLQESQIGPGSIDIRLGYEFIVTHRGNLPYLDPGLSNMELGKKGRFEHKHFIGRNGIFYLHPNELVLAATLEYFKLPISIGGYITSRSSWGRSGLVIATAVAVHAGYTGTITLELLNLGEVPLALRPGLRVAQFIFFQCSGGTPYQGRFTGQISPQSSIAKEEERKDLYFWCNNSNG